MSNQSTQKMEPLRAEFMRDMTQRLESFFSESGFDPDRSAKLSMIFADEFARNWESQLIYIPKNFCVKKAIKHAEIRSRFTGNNHQELATAFQMHVRSIYKIVR